VQTLKLVTYIHFILFSPRHIYIIFLNAGRQLSEDETYELLASAVLMYLKREKMSRSFLNQDRYVMEFPLSNVKITLLSSTNSCRCQPMSKDQQDQSLCVELADKKYEAKVIQIGEGTLAIQFGNLSFVGGGNYVSTITDNPRKLTVKGDFLLGEPVFSLSVDGRDVIVQVIILLVFGYTLYVLYYIIFI